jgi:hypothetical protein
MQGQARDNGLALACRYFFYNELSLKLNEIDALGKSLTPHDEWRLHNLISRMIAFSKICEGIFSMLEQLRIEKLRFHLTLVANAAAEFDPGVAAYFDGLIRVKAIPITDADLLRQKTSDYERTGARIT